MKFQILNFLRFKKFLIIFLWILQIGFVNNINPNNFIEAIKNFEKEHFEIFKKNKNQKFLRFLDENKTEFSNQFDTNFLDLEMEYESYNCKIRPNEIFGQPFGLFPELLGKLRNKDDKFSFENECFTNNEIKITELNSQNYYIKIQIVTRNKKSYLCKHAYFIATTNIYKTKITFLPGIHELIINGLTQDDFDEIRISGLKVFDFCHGFIRGIWDLLALKGMMEDERKIGPDGNLIVEGTEKAIKISKETLEEYGFIFEERRNNITKINNQSYYANNTIILDKKLIKNGDLFSTYVIDGNHTLFMLFSGSRIGHNAVALWEDQELYIVEAVEFIKKNKYDDWMKRRIGHNEEITYHPLREDLRQIFNETAAWEWYYTMDKKEYGYRNLIFSWFDAYDKNLFSDNSNSNSPAGFPTEAWMIIVSILEKFKPEFIHKMLIEGLMLRLNITDDYDKNLTLHNIAVEAAKKNLTVEDVLSMPELETYYYSNGENMICSSLVTKIWKIGGIFGDNEINPKEFTPKDNYQLNIFERDPKKLPKECYEENPEISYCLLNGKYNVILPGYNSITPYDRMNERCPSSAPFYERPDGC